MHVRTRLPVSALRGFLTLRWPSFTPKMLLFRESLDQQENTKCERANPTSLTLLCPGLCPKYRSHAL